MEIQTAITLNDACNIFAPILGIEPPQLRAYAAEDKIGGFNHDVEQRRWQTGSMWAVDGQFIFSIIRAMRAQHVVEIGTWHGCGATHILEALALNEKGHLSSIDINGSAGHQIPLSLRERWSFAQGKAQDVIRNGQISDADIVIEDGPHDIEQTAEILAAARDYLKPKLIISHDGAHFLVGANIREAYRRVFGLAPDTMLIEPSDCGFCWKVF